MTFLPSCRRFWKLTVPLFTHVTFFCPSSLASILDAFLNSSMVLTEYLFVSCCIEHEPCQLSQLSTPALHTRHTGIDPLLAGSLAQLQSLASVLFILSPGRSIAPFTAGQTSSCHRRWHTTPRSTMRGKALAGFWNKEAFCTYLHAQVGHCFNLFLTDKLTVEEAIGDVIKLEARSIDGRVRSQNQLDYLIKLQLS